MHVFHFPSTLKNILLVSSAGICPRGTRNKVKHMRCWPVQNNYEQRFPERITAAPILNIQGWLAYCARHSSNFERCLRLSIAIQYLNFVWYNMHMTARYIVLQCRNRCLTLTNTNVRSVIQEECQENIWSYSRSRVSCNISPQFHPTCFQDVLTDKFLCSVTINVSWNWNCVVIQYLR